MNVLEVYSSFFPKHGGVQRHIYDLCEYMIKLNHKSIILTWIPSLPQLEIVDEIEVHRISMPRLFNLTRYPMIFFLSLHIMLLARRCKIDIIHAHDYLPGLAAALTGIFLKKPVAVTFHLPIQNTTFYPSICILPLFLIEKVLKKCFIVGVNKIICVSNFTYKETLRLGFPIPKLNVIYNWVISSPMQNKPFKKTLKKFNLNGKRYILSVGRLLEKQKLFSVLIYAFKLLLDKKYDLDLVIVGDGPDKEVYRKYALRLNVENHIHFLTDVSNLDLATLYEKCELFVLPSRIEGLPLVILEAMNHSKPIVATKVGGIPEIVEDGLNGILVNPNDNDLALVIEKLLSKPHIMDAYGKSSKNIIMQKFSEHNCKATIVLLEKIAKRDHIKK